MGNTQTVKNVNFEDVQYDIKTPDTYLLINTLSDSNQSCLIVNTVPIDKEEIVINKLLNSNMIEKITIIIYGKNCDDDLAIKKYSQLIDLGFKYIYIYSGGLFEWILLQDIYGSDLFPTTSKQNDILKFKQNKVLNLSLIEY